MAITVGAGRFLNRQTLSLCFRRKNRQSTTHRAVRAFALARFALLIRIHYSIQRCRSKAIRHERQRSQPSLNRTSRPSDVDRDLRTATLPFRCSGQPRDHTRGRWHSQASAPSQTLASNIGGQKRTQTNIVGNVMQAQLRSDSSREATLTGFEPVLPP